MVFCSKCGQPLNGDELFCTRCGRPMNPSGYPVQPGYGPPNQNGWQPYSQRPYGYPPVRPGNPGDPRWVSAGGYLAWAIVCFFLFWPLAIPAVVFASRIDPQNRVANYPAAQYYANRSRLFSLIATCIGGVMFVLSILSFLVALV